MKARYLVVSKVKALANQNRRRLGADFLAVLDAHIEQVVTTASQLHNAGRKTLDARLAQLSIKSIAK